MIYKARGRRYYMVKFVWRGKVIRKSTRATNPKIARAIEGKIRAELAQGNYGILISKQPATMGDFLKKEFLPFVQSKLAAKPGTVQYYERGVERLKAQHDLANLPLDQITDQHAAQFAARLSHLSPSSINCALRTLRRALYLAAEWGKIERKPKITLVTGERQRDRVLTDDEITRYLAVCPQPWRDAATIMLGTGMRPGEVFSLRWEYVLLDDRQRSGLIQVAEGKTKAARRILPMLPEVYGALKARWEEQNRPSEGWVFPSTSRCGHVDKNTAKNQHAKALEESKVKRFEPYVLRHTFGTKFAQQTGCDSFTLARIMGHSTVTITQRYVHPQAEAIERAFANAKLGRACSDAPALSEATEQGVHHD